jgi:hypothetical protein
MTLINALNVVILALGIVFTACKKQEIQGPKGDPGTPGISGNANITFTSNFFVNQVQWVGDTATGSQKVTINFSQLTQNVVDHGSVKVYKLSGTVWSEVPFDTGDLLTQFGFDVGHLYLSYINIEGSPVPPAPATAQYRLVIISQI